MDNFIALVMLFIAKQPNGDRALSGLVQTTAALDYLEYWYQLEVKHD